jgi:prepilin-type N-terminal cleavage/methylation domain-containing protein
MRRKPQGFTLIELTAVLLLIAVLVSIAVTFFTGGSARMRSATGKLVGDIQTTYLRSIQTSKIHRIRFSENLREYAIESFVPPMEKPVNEDDREAMDRWEEYQRQLDEMRPEDRAQLTRMERGVFKGISKKSLPSGIEIQKFYTSRSSMTASDAKIIYFFPSGSADRVALVLSDGGDLLTTIQLNPITGGVSTINGALKEDEWKKLTEPQ